MNSDNISVLKKFNRKLINCRYRVPVTSLVDLLNKGQFGYTTKKDNDIIVTNDFVFADDIATLLKYIRAIFKKPIITTKQESVILNATNATKVDSQALQGTIKDEKLWRVQEGSFSPQYVHTYVNNDNLAIYENRFICFLLDTLYTAVNTKISELKGDLKTLNGEIGGYEQKGVNFTRKTYVDFTSNTDGLVKLITTNDATVGVLSSLIRSKQVIESLKNTDLYIACRKAGGFDGYNVSNTNIFEHDVNYNHCYVFFLKYFNKDVEVASYEDMYKSFVEVNLFGAICDLGYTCSKNNDNIGINNSATLKYKSLVFESNPFNIILSKQDDGIVLTVDNNIDGNSAKYLITINNQLENDASKYVSTFTVVDSENDDDNVFVVIPALANAKEALINLIKTATILVEGSLFVHSRNCPICGSSLISPEDNDCYCVNCNALYHIFNYEYKDIIWIKRLPKYETGMPEAISEDSIRGFDFVSRSFTEKLALATANQQEFYSTLKEYILAFKKSRSKVSFAYDNFFLGRHSKVKFAFRGKTLVMFVALNPKDYEDSKYFPKDFSDVKKYEDTPMMVKIKSTRGVKFAKELIDIVFEGVKRTTSTVVEETPVVKNPTIVEEVIEAPIVEPAIIEEVVETADENGLEFNFVSKSFEEKYALATADQQEFYKEIKEYILAYKKSRSNVSFAYDNFFVGRNSKVKITFRGKTLVMFIALNPKDYEDSKYFPKDFSDVKKYADTPMMIKIKSTRGVKFAKELIDIAFDGIEKIEE